MSNPLAPSVHLTRKDAAQNMARYYDISLQATLFGEVTVLRHWGRIGAWGQKRMQTFAAGTTAAQTLARLEQAKRRRGYC